MLVWFSDDLKGLTWYWYLNGIQAIQTSGGLMELNGNFFYETDVGFVHEVHWN